MELEKSHRSRQERLRISGTTRSQTSQIMSRIS
jgi:hypothetical protein